MSLAVYDSHRPGSTTPTFTPVDARFSMVSPLTARAAHDAADERLERKAGRRLPTWVFTNSDGKPLDGDNLRNRVFYVLLEKAKLRQIRFHDLRHTYASLLIQNGESLAYVK
jgi:integrase